MKNEVILYIAASLDGFIASEDNKLDFLYETPDPQPDYGFERLYSSINTIIMGRATYEYIRKHSQGQWKYAAKKCYVYTRDPNRFSNNEVSFVNTPVDELVKQIWADRPGNIWLMGGGLIIREFLNKNLIDLYDIYYLPTLLGNGVQLFPQGFSQVNLLLESCSKVGDSDVLRVVYRKKNG